jgi:hypothetical protein
VNIIVYYPKTRENINELHKKVAEIHAEAVLRNIQNLPCPKEQKIRLLNKIIDKSL